MSRLEQPEDRPIRHSHFVGMGIRSGNFCANADADQGPATVAHAVWNLYRRGGQGVFLRLLDSGGGCHDFTYEVLVERALCWTHCYAQRGLRPGSHVVVIMQHSLDLYAAYLGALLGGMVPAMFAFPSAKLPMSEYAKTIGRLLENAHPELIVTYPALQAQLGGILTESQRSLLASLSAQVPGARPGEVWLGGSCDDAAFLQYSSGTTGLKKGVAISHRALFWQIEAYGKAIQADDRDRIVSWLPLYHDMGLICCFFLPVLKGIPLVAMSAFDWVKRPGMLLQAISEYRGTLTWLPNFAYNFLARNIDDEALRGLDLSSWRGVVNCSEPVIPESHEKFSSRFIGCGLKLESLAASYAMAETTFAVTSGGFGTALKVERVSGRALAAEGRAVPVAESDPDARKMISSGIALPQTVVRIVDDRGGSLSERCVGEIAVRSPSLMRGYHLNPDATTKALRDGELWTGDLGYMAEGHLFVTGRKKDLIIVAGKNLYPHDIEYCVSQIKGVIPGRVAAFGVPDAEQGTERLVVAVETMEKGQVELASLRRQIFDAVASQTEVVPSDIRMMPHMALLKSSSGKIARNANRERYLQMLRHESENQEEDRGRAETGAETVAACETSTELNSRVLGCVRRVLDRKNRVLPAKFGIDTPLIRGGLIDSLSIVTLVLELENALGVSIPQTHMRLENFDSVRSMIDTLQALENRGQNMETVEPKPVVCAESPDRAGREVLDRTDAFDAYVSLGYDCEIGLQFDRIGYRENGFFSYTYAPLACVMNVLRSDFRGVFRKENLRPHTDGQVRDDAYDIVFHTELRSAVDPDSRERRFLDSYDFDKVYDLFYLLTITHLVNKWRALTVSNRRVMYILKWQGANGRQNAIQMRRLFDELYPRHEATLLCLQTEEYREKDWGVPGLVNRYLPHFAPYTNVHDADLRGWDRIFAEFPLRPGLWEVPLDLRGEPVILPHGDRTPLKPMAVGF